MNDGQAGSTMGNNTGTDSWDLSRLLDDIEVGFFSRDIISQRYLNISNGCLHIYGFSAEEFRANPGLYADVVLPEDKWILDRQSAELSQGKKSCEEYRIVHKDGRIRWIEVRSIPVISKGTLVQVDGAVTDITTRKTSQLELSNANAFIESMISALPGLFYVFDSRGNYKYWNKEVEILTGYTADEFRASHPLDLFAEKDKKLIAENIQLVIDNGHANTEADVLSKDGVTKTPLYFSARRVMLQGEIHIVGVGIDVTERRKTEDVIQKSQEMLTHILNSIPQAIGWKDRDGTFLGCNTVFAKYLGFDSADQMTGRNELELRQYSEEAQRSREDDLEVINSRVPKLHVVETRKLENGSSIWLDSTKIPLKSKENRVYGLLGIFEDITERIEKEERLQKINQDLIQKNIELKQFSYIVSHNLRAPIAKLLGLASLLNRESDDQALNREIVDYIKAEVSDLDSVIKDLNTIVNVQDLGQMPIVEISIAEELKLVLRSLDTDIFESDVRIKTALSAAPSLRSVRPYFYSILYNLISNAIKYRHPGRTPVISIESSLAGTFNCITVKDNGLGIDLNKHSDKLFRLYSRFHTGSVPGKGMGLNLVKTQTETLGGKIEVESQPGVGSVFKIFLPV